MRCKDSRKEMTKQAYILIFKFFHAYYKLGVVLLFFKKT